eukprot:g26.t1
MDFVVLCIATCVYWLDMVEAVQEGDEDSGGQLAYFQQEVEAERELIRSEPLTVKKYFIPLSNFLLIFSFWFFWAQITAISFVPDIPWGFTWLGDIWRVIGELLLLTLIDLDWFDLPVWFGILQFGMACAVAMVFPYAAAKYHRYFASVQKLQKTLALYRANEGEALGKLVAHKEKMSDHKTTIEEKKQEISAQTQEWDNAVTEMREAENEKETAKNDLEQSESRARTSKESISTAQKKLTQHEEMLEKSQDDIRKILLKALDFLQSEQNRERKSAGDTVRALKENRMKCWRDLVDSQAKLESTARRLVRREIDSASANEDRKKTGSESAVKDFEHWLSEVERLEVAVRQAEAKEAENMGAADYIAAKEALEQVKRDFADQSEAKKTAQAEVRRLTKMKVAKGDMSAAADRARDLAAAQGTFKAAAKQHDRLKLAVRRAKSRVDETKPSVTARGGKLLSGFKDALVGPANGSLGQLTTQRANAVAKYQGALTIKKEAAAAYTAAKERNELAQATFVPILEVMDSTQTDLERFEETFDNAVWGLPAMGLDARQELKVMGIVDNVKSILGYRNKVRNAKTNYKASLDAAQKATNLSSNTEETAEWVTVAIAKCKDHVESVSLSEIKGIDTFRAGATGAAEGAALTSQLEEKLIDAYPLLLTWICGDSTKSGNNRGYEGAADFNKKGVKSAKRELAAAKKECETRQSDETEARRKFNDAEKEYNDCMYEADKEGEKLKSLNEGLEDLQSAETLMKTTEESLKTALANAQIEVSGQKELVKHQTIGDKWVR